MPNFPWPSRRDAPEIGDAPLEALLAGTELPADAPSQLQPLSEVLAALKAGPASDELAGEAAALAAFREGLGTPIPERRSRRRPALLRSLPARAAAAATIAALSFGALATAAYAGALPAALQNFAHTRLGAPAAAPTGNSPSPVGPSATGPAAHGLCTAWAQAKAQGNRQNAVAFRKLAAVAGGADKVAAYCAKAPEPGARGSSTPHAKGKPSIRPTPYGKGKPSTHPTPHGKGKPSTHPTPHSRGRSSTQPTPHAS